MKSIFVILSIFFFFHSTSIGQEYENLQGFRIGLTPSALFNKWVGFQGKASYMYKRFELEANVGYLAGKNNDEPYSGIRIRPLLKYYFAESSDGSYYFGLGGVYRKVNVDATGTFGRYNTSYFQSLDFKLKETLRGFNFMFGILMPLRNENFLIDLGIGLGNSLLKIEHFDVPEDAQFYTNTPLFSYDTRTPDTINFLILFGHVSFMYKF